MKKGRVAFVAVAGVLLAAAACGSFTDAGDARPIDGDAGEAGTPADATVSTDGDAGGEGECETLSSVTLFSNIAAGGAIAADGVDVYWAAAGGVHFGPVGGGTAKLFAPFAGAIAELVLSPQHVLWRSGDGNVDAKPKGTAASVDASAVYTENDDATFIAPRDIGTFVAGRSGRVDLCSVAINDCQNFIARPTVKHLIVRGGAYDLLQALGPALVIANCTGGTGTCEVDDAGVLTSDVGLTTTRIASDDEWIYWLDPEAAKARRVRRATAAIEDVMHGVVEPVGLGIDGTGRLVAALRGKGVFRAPADGTCRIPSGALTPVTSLAVTTTGTYWVSGSEIHRANP